MAIEPFYNCGVLNCGGGKCVHRLLEERCPCCGNALVEVTTTGFIFCSDKSGLCEYQQTEEVKILDNQHRQIAGYRELTADEIELMNEGKALGKACGDYIAKLEALPDADKRSVALGKTNLQQGLMWAIRGVARPTTF